MPRSASSNTPLLLPRLSFERVGHDRQTVVVIQGLSVHDRARDADGQLGAAGIAGGQALHRGVVIVEGEAEFVGHLPVRIEAHRTQRVRLIAPLLLEAVVLADAGGLGNHHWRGNGLVGVERDRARLAHEPECLVATIFLQVVLGVRVVGGQHQRVHRLELHGQLAVLALALAIGVVIAQVVRQAVELADGRCVAAPARRVSSSIAPDWPPPA